MNLNEMSTQNRHMLILQHHDNFKVLFEAFTGTLTWENDEIVKISPRSPKRKNDPYESKMSKNENSHRDNMGIELYVFGHGKFISDLVWAVA